MSKKLSKTLCPRRRIATLAAAAVLVACGAQSLAQSAGGIRIYNEQLRVRLDERRPTDRETSFDAGGWLTFGLFYFDDTLGDRHTLRQYQGRAWASLNIENVHRFYIRGLYGYDDWNSGNNLKNYQGDEDTGPQIERAWYEFDLGRLLAGPIGRRPDFGAKIKVGREYVTIGTGLTLAMAVDAIQFELEPGNWRLRGLMAKSIESSINPVDTSGPVATHQNRCLWGAEIAYSGIDNHQPFVYYLLNSDSTSPHPSDPAQRYDYDSQYLGIGSSGTIFSPNLQYRAEVVGEWGTTYSNNTVDRRDDICAMAANLMFEYLFDVPTRPAVAFEYLYGSGDDDRLVSSSSTAGGNRRGTDDNAFNAFGFRDTGISFAPKISNIHIYSLGATCFPLENTKLFEKFQFGTKVFFYHKAKAGGPISDTTAVKSSKWLGWEWDIYADWRITSDVSWTIRYGVFQPGSAFGNDNCRQFLLTAVTWSF